MNINYLVIAIEWIVIIALLVKFIPKNKIKIALIAFHCTQLITWVLGLLIVQLKLIEYPIRLFTYANKTSFTFEYFAFPSFCAIFNVYYPEKKSAFGQFMYYFYYCTTLTVIEVFVEKYTDTLKYIHWSWYITWITLLITFYLTRKYCIWFFKQDDK